MELFETAEQHDPGQTAPDRFGGLRVVEGQFFRKDVLL